MSAASISQTKRATGLRMTPPATRRLADAISARLLPPFLKAGFREVPCWYDDAELEVTGREIRLERRGNGAIDSVHIMFDKYRGARVQISAARRDDEHPLRILRGANVTTASGKDYSWWGKPWWMPSRFWSEHSSDRVATQLANIEPQILAFLETGERGTNIGRSNEGIAY